MVNNRTSSSEKIADLSLGKVSQHTQNNQSPHKPVEPHSPRYTLVV